MTWECSQLSPGKALRRAKICTYRFILWLLLVNNASSSLIALQVWWKLCHSFVDDTNGQKISFVCRDKFAQVWAIFLVTLVSFRCFAYSFLLIWYLPICFLTYESYLLYSVFPLCLIWRVVLMPYCLCLWSHVIQLASYSLNSLLDLPKKIMK